jgi:hypothetical protein
VLEVGGKRQTEPEPIVEVRVRKERAHGGRGRILQIEFETTPDLVSTKYRAKLTRFVEELLAAQNAGKPLMKQFYASYFDLYWDLHLGVRGEAIPSEVRQFGSSFTAVPSANFVWNALPP